jgi:hypothetical protein
MPSILIDQMRPVPGRQGQAAVPFVKGHLIYELAATSDGCIIMSIPIHLSHTTGKNLIAAMYTCIAVS